MAGVHGYVKPGFVLIMLIAASGNSDAVGHGQRQTGRALRYSAAFEATVDPR